jgi:hypothetical protein
VRAIIKIVLWLAAAVTAIPLAFALGYFYVVWTANSVVFRSAVEWHGTKPSRSKHIRKWRLEIPKEFVVRKDGYRFAPYELDGQRLSFVWISSRLSDHDQVVPYSCATVTDQDFTITLRNSLVDKRHAEEDYCLTNYQLAKLPSCTDRPNCKIHINYFGWPAEISVRQNDDLFKDPARVCNIARAALSKWTKSIDDLRVSRSKN